MKSINKKWSILFVALLLCYIINNDTMISALQLRKFNKNLEPDDSTIFDEQLLQTQAQLGTKVNSQSQWGFMKNIINIDTFFYDPNRRKSGEHRSDESDVQTDGIDGVDPNHPLDFKTQEEKRDLVEQKKKDKEKELQLEKKKQEEAKQKRELEAKEQLKKIIQKEAAEKMVEQMMVGLDEESMKGSNSTVSEVDEEKQKLGKIFKQGHKFSVLSSLPSKPDEVKLAQNNCTNEKEVNDKFDSIPGLKMMFVNGKLLQTNFKLLDNEFEYYRLIGEAYNQHILDRAVVPQSKTQQIAQMSKDKNNNKKKGTSLEPQFTYVINGIPQTISHDSKNDVKYGYAKHIFINDKKTKEPKLFSQTCQKLKYNHNQKRINECRLASGYFIVNQCGLFKQLYDKSKDFKKYGVE